MRFARIAAPVALVGLLSLAAWADSLTDIPKRISDFKSALSKYKDKLKPVNFANPAKRTDFDKDLEQFRKDVADYAKFVSETEDGDLVAKAQAPTAKGILADAYMALAEAAIAGCDYQTAKETVEASKETVTKDADKTKLQYWRALALLRLVRRSDSEAACQDLGRSGGAKQAASLLAELKDKTAETKSGKPMPSFGYRGVKGEKVAIPEGETGHVCLIDFWATWCGPCKQEMPNVIALYNELHAEGFDVAGISLDTEEASLKQYIEENKMPWPQYFDGQKWDNFVAKWFGVTGIPHTVLLDKTGKVAAVDLRGEELAKKVRELMGKAKK